MRKSGKFMVLLVLSLLLLTACDDNKNTERSLEKVGAENPQTIEETNTNTEATEDVQASEGTVESTEDATVTQEFQQILLKNPSYESYLAVESDIPTEPVKLSLVSESQNEITDTGDWFINNDLYLNSISERYQYGALGRYTGEVTFNYEKWRGENQICFYDDTYIYTVSMENDIYCLLTIFDKVSEEALYQIDFSDFCFRSEDRRLDNTHAVLEINWAESCNNVLYVAMVFNGYAEPNISFVVAVSLETMEVIWKSDSLVCNSYNFIIERDVLLCGYGFTAEPDFLYQLDLRTGKVLDKVGLKTKPDYLVLKNGQLYIRCYNVDYVFDVK